MAPTNDPQDIARRYLDLWLDHWERSARDPEAVDAMARMVQEAVTETADFHRRVASGLSRLSLGHAASPFGPWMEVMQQTAERAAKQNDEEPAGTKQSTGDGNPDGTDGAAPPSPASGDGTERVAQLLQRIAELESRIEHLERAGGPAARRGKSSGAAGRRPTKRSG